MKHIIQKTLASILVFSLVLGSMIHTAYAATSSSSSSAAPVYTTLRNIDL